MRKALILALLVMLGLCCPTVGVTPAQAAAGCEGADSPKAPEWNVTAQHLALVPHASWAWSYEYEDDMRVEEKQSGSNSEGDEGSADPGLHPENQWTYNPSYPQPTLEPLTTGIFETLAIGNDSAGVLRLNLSSTHRTTFCVHLFEMGENGLQPVDADVYLLTSSQYDAYEEVYRSMHGGGWFWDLVEAGEGDELLSDVPPEWRSFNPLGWQTYRDVHQYEARSEVTFSVSMDAPEVYSSLFGGTQWQDFYLIIDAWDNTNDNDVPATNSVLYADITVIPVERTVLLPPWTVPLVLFVALAAVVLLPVVLNRRYMGAGLDQGAVASDSTSVPYLEQSANESHQGK